MLKFSLDRIQFVYLFCGTVFIEINYTRKSFFSSWSSLICLWSRNIKSIIKLKNVSAKKKILIFEMSVLRRHAELSLIS